ncbi:MAG: PEP-CTERM sorting domain-containing protein [Gammaproteobacteria bacterium]|nr:PEP-CTERM sorting domain-containing protein [Gammaproteobacteria bacterium]MCP5201547.1 PEP-CTERM sorting domain-containing protein [Gammaproteobacteria bacterium]
MLTRQRAAFAVAALLSTFVALPAAATVVWQQGFESDTAGWFDQANGWTGAATRVLSGTGGIASADGVAHGVFEQTDTQGVGLSGPFSQFDGYRSAWPGPYTASIDIYLDPTWAPGSGFDYSVASSSASGGHLRDFIFHVTSDTSTGSLLVGGSNNTNFDPREDLETINHAVIANAGWYTFEHQFMDVGGVLSVDLVLLDAVGTELFRETRSNAADLIGSVAGGNRYAWFTNIDIASGIAVDNHTLTLNTVPEPAALGLVLAGLAGVARRRRR